MTHPQFEFGNYGGWFYPQPPNVPFELNTASPQAQGLIGWWPMLSSRGAQPLRDLSNKGAHHGVFLGAGEDPAWIQTVLGAALDFDGIDDLIDLGTFFIGTGSHSLTVWANLNQLPTVAGANMVLMQKGDDSAGGGWGLLLVAADVGGGIDRWGTSCITTAGGLQQFDINVGTPTINTWTHLATTFNNETTTLTLYINGVFAASVGTNANLRAANHSLLGKFRFDLDQAPLDGQLVDARMYDRALPAAEVLQIYDPASRWQLYRPLRRWWAGAIVAVPTGQLILTTYAGYSQPVG